MSRRNEDGGPLNSPTTLEVVPGPTARALTAVCQSRGCVRRLPMSSQHESSYPGDADAFFNRCSVCSSRARS